jgi:8-oxo-dGTP pyrophosphatase MutT (NUDIX family)
MLASATTLSVVHAVTAGEESLPTARRETLEEVGVEFPAEVSFLLHTFEVHKALPSCYCTMYADIV